MNKEAAQNTEQTEPLQSAPPTRNLVWDDFLERYMRYRKFDLVSMLHAQLANVQSLEGTIDVLGSANAKLARWKQELNDECQEHKDRIKALSEDNENLKLTLATAQASVDYLKEQLQQQQEASGAMGQALEQERKDAKWYRSMCWALGTLAVFFCGMSFYIYYLAS